MRAATICPTCCLWTRPCTGLIRQAALRVGTHDRLLVARQALIPARSPWLPTCTVQWGLVIENPAVGATEIWEIYNATGDAHPMHIHEIVFEVINRQDIFVNEMTQEVQVVPGSAPFPPEPWETGFKDTVIVYPGQVTRIRAQFNTPGQFVWHCHIVEHEDNEMMRPFIVE